MGQRRIGAALLMGAAAAALAFGRAEAQVRPDTSHAAHHPAPRDTSRAAHAGHDMGAMPGMTPVRDTLPTPLQHAGLHDAMSGRRHAGMKHEMLMREFAGGWQLLGMAQAFAMTTWAAPRDADNPLHDTESYLTQPAAMVNVLSPGATVALRTTLNFEALTQPQGEIAFGGWGEGFIDRRHPHTFLHEAVLSLNLWDVGGGALSFSAGKGFAPYGTDDPMSRPVAKYPTNHHLSQILERWLVMGQYLRGPWSVEASVFGGQEPDGPWDLGNLSSFGNSFSGRVMRRFGGTGTTAPWELSASFGSVAEEHAGTTERTRLYNGSIRHSGAHSFGGIYAMAEASVSDPGDGDGFWSVLGETQVRIARHRPYYRIELATRPEYLREDVVGTEGFFRYDHDAHPVGASRWLISSLGYEFDLSGGGVATRPFVEVQHNRVSRERGPVPAALLDGENFWSVSAGFRLFFGGGPMRMGSYGALDDMTLMHHPLDGMDSMPAMGH
ncbi:MAG TPA: hypothetical protein VF092_05495 [Longimicrobium sp.]